jgi:predicted DNA-binding ribbon-helix-helix protein
MKKRSVTIAGHQTSITLEEEFWQELKSAAVLRKQSLNELVTEIDRTRDLKTNLSSALRLFILGELKNTHSSS